MISKGFKVRGSLFVHGVTQAQSDAECMKPGTPLNRVIRLSLAFLRRSARTHILLLASVMTLAGVTGARADTGCMVAVEDIHHRTQSIPDLLPVVAKSVADANGQDVSAALPVITPFVKKAFDNDAVLKLVSEGQAIEACKDDALLKIAESMKAIRQQVSALPDNDAVLSQIKGTPDKIEKLQNLARSMAGPALAAETALTAQVMQSAIQAYFSDQKQILTGQSEQETEAMIASGIAELQNKTENQGQFDRKTASEVEVIRVAILLDRLPDADIDILQAFYESENGKKQRQALISAYSQALLEADKGFLNSYFAALKMKFKSENGG